MFGTSTLTCHSQSQRCYLSFTRQIKLLWSSHHPMETFCSKTNPFSNTLFHLPKVAAMPPYLSFPLASVKDWIGYQYVLSWSPLLNGTQKLWHYTQISQKSHLGYDRQNSLDLRSRILLQNWWQRKEETFFLTSFIPYK